MKKEIHLRLIRRIGFIFLITVLVISAGALFLEYRRLDNTIFDHALKESSVFASFFGIYHNDPGSIDNASLEMMASASLERTSFIQIDLFNRNQEHLTHLSREGGDTIREMFNKKGISLPLNSAPDSAKLFSNKRIYLTTVLPIYNSPGDDIIGYIRGIYRVSLEDMQTHTGRFILTIALVTAGVLLCCLLIYPGMAFLNNHLIRSTGELNKANGFLLRTLGSAIARLDTPDTGHNYRVMIYAVRLAEQQGLPRTQIRQLIHGAFLHDIGMLPVESSIMQKQGALEPEEYDQIKKHTKDGMASIKRVRWLRSAEAVVRYHHEKYDGSGYPAGLAHEKIPFLARIFTIADSFDALTSDRFYRKALPVPEALAVMEQESASHFDPVLLSAFVEMAPKLHGAVLNLDEKKLMRELEKVLKRYLQI